MISSSSIGSGIIRPLGVKLRKRKLVEEVIDSLLEDDKLLSHVGWITPQGAHVGVDTSHRYINDAHNKVAMVKLGYRPKGDIEPSIQALKDHHVRYLVAPHQVSVTIHKDSDTARNHALKFLMRHKDAPSFSVDQLDIDSNHMIGMHGSNCTTHFHAADAIRSLRKR